MNNLTGLILCGGKGSRLEGVVDVPKPLIKLDDKEILTYIVENFRRYGIENIYLTTKYRKRLFKGYAKKNDVRTLELSKPFESQSGNIWPGLEFDTDVLMSVGDTITDIDIDDLHKFHRKNKSDLTITSKILDYKIPFGTMIKRGNKLRQWREKPQFRVEVALGLSLINREIFKSVPRRKFDIPDLFNLALREGYNVCVYPYYRDYIKIDTVREYEEAQQKIKLMHRD